ncbi:WecB/TagA/CpsF family glycosyltransferase [Spirosoma sp.]|uniref:WecB/TagA/CpsF family glycosyltransferase n=1 Tax=Spirosoma sp. TaxID=1899569 RepID=UPI0026227A90|nr:WecB/TagA/CpsF family glycosyltransferase [Spirosoma sp.]MCX6217775.1 WecB/TagA/CpsF family glycosyltransferase [Spirosoma sp.]
MFKTIHQVPIPPPAASQQDQLKQTPERRFAISLGLTILSYNAFIQTIIGAARQRKAAYGCFANVHMVVEAVKDAVFADAVNNSTWVTPDGVPLLWTLRAFYRLRQDRITGLDVLPSLLEEAARNQLPVYFYGCTPPILEQCRAFCVERYPTLTIAGMCSPPFRALSREEEQQAIANINASGASIVFVSLGCPKQEKWMAAVSEQISAVLLGIGGALPVLVGAQKRAPKWMQRRGLEWFYRLVQEPRRLISRYVITNCLFVYYFLRDFYYYRIRHQV